MRAAGSLTIALPNVPYYVEQVRVRVPGAQLTTVETVDALFAPRGRYADAFAIPAERGSAWTLRYPQYAVVVPLPDPIKVPLAFALDTLYRYWSSGATVSLLDRAGRSSETCCTGSTRFRALPRRAS